MLFLEAAGRTGACLAGLAGLLLSVFLLPTAVLAQDVCGDGSVAGAEACDDGNTASGDCCSSTCQFEPDGSACDDDGSVCSSDLCDGAGVCVHAAANAGVLCRDQVVQSGLGAVEAGGLGFPAAISKDWFETHACGSSEPILIFPTSGSSCANLHTFTKAPATASEFGKVVDGLTNGTFTTPLATAGTTEFEFVGGSIESKCSNLRELFGAKKQNGVWTFLIPVHDRECSNNVTQSVLIVGFATARITEVVCTPSRRLEIFIDCDLLTVGQGGGPDYGTLVEGFGVCDAPEYCDGTSPTCPPDGKSTAVCRPSSGACDLAESCDGTSGLCPADAKSTGVCRTTAGACDQAEICDGIADSCPADDFLPSSTVCRVSQGVCDLEETCTGLAAACPSDALRSSSTTCRASNGICDPAETCTGLQASCPADTKSTALCRPAGGACDLAETCDGTGDACPVDAKASGLCRASSGVCDAAEACDGTSNSCPADSFATTAVTCRGATGVCDLAESCSGSGAACPADTLAPPGAACGAPASGTCSGADTCDAAGDCLANDAPDGTPCDDGHACTAGDTCLAGICGAGELACDDGNPCTQDSCDSEAQACRHDAVPATTCLAAGKSSLTVKLGSRGKVKWKWSRGAATICDDLGAPSIGTDFDLCVYDGVGGGEYSTASHYRVPTGVLWSVRGDCDWTYFDRGAGADGIRKVRIKARDTGRSSIFFDARAPGASFPTPVAEDRLLTMDPNVLVQLHNSQGACWESDFVEARKNSAERFGAKGAATLEP